MTEGRHIAPATDGRGTRRSAGPDQLKALLLVLVVFGHAYMIPLGEDLTRYLVYSIHMPAFLFLSGYLIREPSLRGRSFWRLISHYWWRMLLAWLAVSLLWRWVQRPDPSWAWRDLLQDVLLVPNFHLWYIPALMLAIVVAWIAVRTPRPAVLLGLIGGAGFLLTPAAATMVEGLPYDARYTSYLAYFVFGMLVRNGWAKVLPPWWALATFVAGLALRVAVFDGATALGQVSWIAANLGALSLIPVLLRALERPLPVIGPVLVRVGVFSLWIYLLHPFLTFGTWRLDVLQPASIPEALAVTLAILAAGALARWLWELLGAGVARARRGFGPARASVEYS